MSLPRNPGLGSRALRTLRQRSWPLYVEPLEDRSLLNAASALVDWQLAGDRPFTTTEVIAGLRSAAPLADLARSTALPGAVEMTSPLFFSETEPEALARDSVSLANASGSVAFGPTDFTLASDDLPFVLL